MKHMGKNQKLRAKLTGTTVALAMAGGMLSQTTLPVYAANVTAPSDSKTTMVKVLNVDKAATVTAYRIVSPVYNEEGFVAFRNVNGVNISNPEDPQAAEITAIAQSILKGTITPDKVITMNGQNGTYQGNLPAGEYIILVTDSESADTVYNPMVVSAYYADANDADSLTASAPLDATGSFGTVYAKKTSIPLDKTILQADGNSGADDDGTENGAQGDDLAVGDTGTFQISTKIPAYSEAYKANGVIYTLTDTQDEGFDAPTDLSVTVGGESITASDTTFTQTINGNDFTLDFASDFVLAHAGQEVTVTYHAVLNNKAKQKLEKNTDKVVLTYTNDVYDKEHVDTLEDDVAEFTFPVQIKKVASVDGVNTGGGQAIAGAEFTLTRTDGEGKTGTQTLTITTDENGIAQFDRLDEGVYTLKETKAPAGYALNPDTFQISITPTYGTDGNVASYAVKMVNTRDQNEIGNITIDSADDDILAGNITDSKLQTLPSTGGRGTRLAMLIAAAMSGVTLCLFAFGKKKERESEE